MSEPAFNYRYFVEHAARASSPVLDYGCGIGQTLELGLQKDVDIWGADTFSGGHYQEWDAHIPEAVRSRVSKIENGRIAFPDDHFGFIFSNQVIEHVTDPEAVFAEIYRVLKPGGTFMAAFPVTETFYEGHVGLYFAHRFKPGRLRDAYFSLAHRLGFGLYRRTITRQQWVTMSLNTLDTFCYYYPRRRIYDGIAKIFGSRVQDMTVDYMRARLGKRSASIPAAADFLLRQVYLKRAGEIFCVRKPESAKAIAEAA